ncbi:hypothetical protein D3C83_65050 [compost metagenome]
MPRAFVTTGSQTFQRCMTQALSAKSTSLEWPLVDTGPRASDVTESSFGLKSRMCISPETGTASSFTFSEPSWLTNATPIRFQ